MSEGLLLDTHIALWLDNGDARLGGATRNLIDGLWRSGGTLYFSAVSVWEIAVLADIGRIQLRVAIEDWVDQFLALPGITAVPLSHRAAARSYSLNHLHHRDPADRLLIATAIELSCPLVTHDGPIARFARQHGRQYGFAVAT